MTNEEVNDMFWSDWELLIKKSPWRKNDEPLKSEMYGILLDDLNRSGEITDEEYANYTLW